MPFFIYGLIISELLQVSRPAHAGLPKSTLIHHAEPTAPEVGKEDSEDSEDGDDTEDSADEDAPEEGKAPKLVWLTQDSLTVTPKIQSDQTVQLLSTLEWSAPSSSLVFLFGSSPVPAQGKTSRYQIQVPLEAETTPVSIQAIDPTGQVSSEEVEIHYPPFASTLAKVANRYQHPFSITPSLGGTFIEMDQPGSTGLTEWGVNFQVNATYALKAENWSLGASIWTTPIPFGSSRSNVTATVYGGEAHATYELPWLTFPWNLSLSSGLLFTTLSVSQQALGFQNVTAFQLFPTLTYEFNKENQVTLSFKYLPIFAGFSFLTLDSRIIDAHL
jgi:hypothetical protein